MGTRKQATRYRGWVIDNLKPLLPRAWSLVPYTRVPDAINRTTVIVGLRSIERLPEAPMASHVTEYVVTIASPAADPAQADEDLDDDIADLLHALDMLRDDSGRPILRWTRAERAVLSDTYLAFDITVNVITTATPNKE